MDVTLPDGTTVTNVPDGTTRQQLAEKLRAGGRNVPADWLPKPKDKPEAPSSPMDTIVGGAEAGLSMASGFAGGLAGNVAGAARTLTGGKYGTPEGIQQGVETGNKVADALTYTPRSKAGQDMLHGAGKFLDDTKIAGMNPAIANEIPIGTMQAMRAKAAPALDRLGAAAEETVAADRAPPPEAAAMPGVGAAETDVSRMRRERAGSLPVPLSLSKGQATRDFERQRFERETAKDGKVGKPLREHFAEQNEKILQNFDAWLDQTGASAPDLYATGQAVDKALVAKAKRAKAEINAEYDKARKQGEMQTLVPTDDLVAYLEKNRPAAVNAPVLKAIEDKLVQLQGATKAEGGLQASQISINDLEELRKFIGETMDGTQTNTLRGKQAKEVIDAMTEGRGGDVYKAARAKRTQYAKEFEDHAVISRLLDTKPGTKDRAIAMENVFKTSVLGSSQDDLRILEKTLKDAGGDGEQAWRELQGQTVQYLKETATKSATTDVRGNRIVSAAALDKAVLDLDRKGKLDILFGKQGAQMVRDINDIAKDVHTAPPGAVNTSGTTSTLIEALSHVPVIGKYPLAVKAVAAIKKTMQDRRTKKQVDEALEQPE